METTVTTILLFLHFSGLMLGGAAGLGQMVVAKRMRLSPSPALMSMRPAFGAMGLAGILLLWFSGLLLWFFRYDFVDLGPAFHTKLTIAALLLVIIVALHIVVHRALSQGRTPPSFVRALGMSTPFLTVAAVALAVYIFQ